MDNKQNAKYAFYYLLSLVALIFMSFAVGMIIFSIIDKTIVDALNNYSSDIDGALKFGISSLFISTPIFYFIILLINKGLLNGELSKDSAIRRWLTYFIILVSSLTILGVLISVINNYLSGELTARFSLKAVSVFLLSALPFSYYFYDIKRLNPDKTDKILRIFFYGTLSLVLAAFIAAWFFVESPKVARARRLDQSLVQNIASLESYVNSYYDKNKKLPVNLEELRGDKNLYLDNQFFVDPETKKMIVYNKLDDKSFEFCADFRTDSIKSNNAQPVFYPGQDIYSKEHRSGYQCLLGNLYAVVKTETVK